MIYYFEAVKKIGKDGTYTIRGRVEAHSESGARIMAYGQVKRLGGKGFTIIRLEETNDNS